MRERKREDSLDLSSGGPGALGECGRKRKRSSPETRLDEACSLENSSGRGELTGTSSRRELRDSAMAESSPGQYAKTAFATSCTRLAS